ncbi:uncharacterized protein Z520_06276 [Fonsecaea multimorphosa CBS 102226]|uniref:Pheromone a factor receptor n=1 Tax=Fonsecaea multimorphosa CBS 102226 TaxID=1442371 RepID=A0A0D2IMD9_9EURO|nr:uncharacterized protein Z520_06276 [Fonsecaea multimorphosa CBS 102226]KIX98196.1 hypothetical protein Z520_06276 [Fonsecaea multimorphosa CBS 102226]OAL22667.1 hypothetical protein AYO22_07226 [Fonsecaea multimorphosa]
MTWDTSSVLVVPLALLAIVAAFPPIFVQLRAKNFAASVLLIGITILNIQNLVNAVIWSSDNPDDWWDGKILCDIEVKLYIGIFQAVEGAIASIFRQISIILDSDRMTVTPCPQQRRTTLKIELVLCILLPVLVMAGHYLVQKERYWLGSVEGCVVSYDNDWVAPFVTYGWPMVVCVIGSVYCLISVVRLWRHRKQVSALLSHTPGATASRFFRLFALAFVLLVIYCPLAIFAFAQNVRVPMHMYSWSYIHPADWSERIILEPEPALRPTSQGFSFDRWAQIITAYTSFACFGMGQDAIRMYKRWAESVRDFLCGGFRGNVRLSQQAPRIGALGQNEANVTFVVDEVFLEDNHNPAPHSSASGTNH